MSEERNIVGEIINQITNQKRNHLMENESKDILKIFNINFPKFIIVHNEEQVLKAAKKIGFPVVLKIMSPDIIHKSDFGGVILNLKNENEVTNGFKKIMENISKIPKQPRITGIMVCEMAKKGLAELIVGVSYDEQFGHSILVGLGGVYVELLKDVSIRLIPITKYDAQQMLRELKSYPILKGYRGTPKADINSIIKLLIKISNIIVENPNILEIDLNPVMVYKEGLSVLDSRMIIKV
jgi:acyl-CoA synthetase (NDP forming)